MRHPFPDVDLGPPTADQVAVVGRGVASIASGPEGLTPLQELLLSSYLTALTDHPYVPGEALSPEGLADALADRSEAFRHRVLQLAILLALVLDPLPLEVVDRLCWTSQQLGIPDDQIHVARDMASGNRDAVLEDFARSGWTSSLSGATTLPHAMRLAALDPDDPWAVCHDDPALAARWRSLEGCDEGTLGLGVWKFYSSRGFRFPGQPDSAPPLLAQHDWVHVLADYGSTLESELEVFGLIARATDDPRGFSLLSMVVGLFETGALTRGAGLFQADRGHLSSPGVAARLADGMRRGALMRWQGSGDVRLLELDWWSLADEQLTALRERFELRPKLASGSVGTFEPGSMSPYQDAAGRVLARERGRTYGSFGASAL